MNIVIPTADYPPIEGGLGTLSLHVSRELAKLGHTVTVIAPYFPGMSEFDAREPVSVVRFRGYELGWLRFFPMFAKSLPYLRGAELVLGVNIAYGATMAWLLRRPYMTFAYAYEFLKFGRGPVASLFRKIYAGSLRTISISRFTALELEKFGVPHAHITTILPGAPPALRVSDTTLSEVRARFAPENERLLLAVGRLIGRKGHATLLDAMPLILEKHPGTRLVIVGRGPLSDSLLEQARRLGIADSVGFPGYLGEDEVAALYSLCTLFVLPTGSEDGGRVEGFGLVFAEANAYGKPAIGGRSGGTVDAIRDGETGLLVEPGNARACAEAVNELLSDPARCQAIGEAGRARVASELNWTAFSRELMRVADEAR